MFQLPYILWYQWPVEGFGTGHMEWRISRNQTAALTDTVCQGSQGMTTEGFQHPHRWSLTCCICTTWKWVAQLPGQVICKRLAACWWVPGVREPRLSRVDSLEGLHLSNASLPLLPQAKLARKMERAARNPSTCSSDDLSFLQSFDEK